MVFEFFDIVESFDIDWWIGNAEGAEFGGDAFDDFFGNTFGSVALSSVENGDFGDCC